MSIKLYTDKSEIFECNVSLEGASIKDSKLRAILKFDDKNLMVEGKIKSNGKGEIVVKTAVKVDVVDKEIEAVDTTAVVQETGDESESLEEESSEDTDKDSPDEVVVDEPQDDVKEPEEESKPESN